MPVGHADDRLACLLYPCQDLLVLDLEFGIALCLTADLLPVGVVLTRVGSYIGQDGQLVDVGIVFGVDVFQFWMKCCIAFAGQTGIAFIHLDEWITFMKVDVVVVAGKPGGGDVGDLVGLGTEGLVLNEAAEGFGIAEVFLEGWGRSYAGAQLLLVVTAGEAIDLS